MNNVRNLFRVLCILVVVLSFTNCQHDATTDIEQQQATLQKEFPFTSSLLTKQDIEANTKLSNQMRSLAMVQAGSLAESVYNSSYNFTVLTDVVKFVESTENNAHSYTFPIARENSTGNELENLVFSYDEAMDDYTASLVTYHFSASQQQEFLLTQHVRTPYDITHEPIAVNLSDVLAESDLTTPCTTTYTVYHITPDTGETFVYSSTNGNIQNTCEHEYDDDPCQTYTVIEIDCPDGGSSSGNDSGTPSPNNPNSSPTGGGNDSGNGTTTPNDDDEEPNVVTSPISKQEYLELIEELNERFGEENWEFDEDASEGAPSFESVDDLEAYLDSFTSEESTLDSSDLILGQENIRQDISSLRFSGFPRTDLVTTIKVVQPAPNVALEVDDFKNVRVKLEGNNTFFEWTQYDTENPADEDGPTMHIFPDITSIVVHIEGEVQVGLNIKGNPIRVKRLITVSINYNYVTGELQPQDCRWFYTN